MISREPVSVLLMAHNEVDVIEEVVRSFVDAVVVKLPGSECIVAEDGSTDGTKAILERLAVELPIRVVMGTVRKGYVQAYRDALALPALPLVFFSDGGGKHDPKDFWTLYERKDVEDMIIGFKSPRRDPWYRIVLTRLFNGVLNGYFGTRFRDANSGFRLMRRPVIDGVLRAPWRLRAIVNAEVTMRAYAMGFRVGEVPVTHFRRLHGDSRGLPLKKIPGVVWHVLTSLPLIKGDVQRLRASKAAVS